MAEPTEFTNQNSLARLKKKYRLDELVKTSEGQRYLIDPSVFNKLAAADTTQDKRFLDWMLFMAGGGQSAMDASMAIWGDADKKRPVETILKAFRTKYPNEALNTAEIKAYADLQKIPEVINASAGLIHATGIKNLAERRQAILEALAQAEVSPPAKRGERPEERAAAVDKLRKKITADLTLYRLRYWFKQGEFPSTQRERVETLQVSISLSKGLSPEEAQQLWEGKEQKCQFEFLFGSESVVTKVRAGDKMFGFYYSMPGRPEASYDALISTVREFISLSSQQLDKADVPAHVSLDIGEVVQNQDGSLNYEGDYESLRSLAETSKVLRAIPARKRVRSDVRFVGKGGKVGPGEKLYSDKLLDVMAPATLAASISAGHPSWDISNPRQLDALDYDKDEIPVRDSNTNTSDVAWRDYHQGMDVYPEPVRGTYFGKPRPVSVIFHVKASVPEGTQKLLLTCPLEDLVASKGANTAIKYIRTTPVLTVFIESGKEEVVSMDVLLTHWKKEIPIDVYNKLEHSMTEAIRSIYRWAIEHDIRFVEPDPLKSAAAARKRRSLMSEAKRRARQLVNLLIS
jgi:hypothetical protein